MDRLAGVLLAAGLGCFALAFVLTGFYPYMITDARRAEASIEEVAQQVSPDFKLLEQMFPVAFAAAFDGSEEALQDTDLAGLPEDAAARATSEERWRSMYAVALRRGRDVYIGEACWHCHSQYVRPVANEEQRFGPVQTPAHDNNALQRPVLWGTRRVGPDLTHEGGRRSNDWHVAHFWNPKDTSPDSVMPRYPWFYREGFQIRRKVDTSVASRWGIDAARTYAVPGIHDTQAGAQAALQTLKGSLPETLAEESERLVIEEGRGLNRDGISLVAYLQWLGTWEPPPMEEEVEE